MEFGSVSSVLMATRYLLWLVARALGLTAGSQPNGGMHAHWDRESREWVRPQVE
jgi:hypothetical protein